MPPFGLNAARVAETSLAPPHGKLSAVFSFWGRGVGLRISKCAETTGRRARSEEVVNFMVATVLSTL